MAYLAAFLMVAMMATITLDVVLRNLGYQSSAHFFTFTEYALLIVPCLGAPWLAREKGHIYVEILLMSMAPRARARMTMLIGVVCIAVCLVIAWYGFEVPCATSCRTRRTCARWTCRAGWWSASSRCRS